MKIIKKRGKKKLYRKFQMELSQTAREEIDRIIKDHIMVTDIWDNKHLLQCLLEHHITPTTLGGIITDKYK